MARSRPRDEAIYQRVYAAARARGTSEAYARRIASAEARGRTGAARRGHGPAEHQTRAERSRAAGRLTENERAWLKRQQQRIRFDDANEAGKLRWQAAVEAFTAMTPAERNEVRRIQAERQKSRAYASYFAPSYGDTLSPMYLSNRSGLR